jgi:hypothetical protein
MGFSVKEIIRYNTREYFETNRDMKTNFEIWKLRESKK